MSGGERHRPAQERDRVPGRSAVAWWVGTVLVVAASTAVSFVALQWAAPESRDALPPAPDRLGTGGMRRVYTRDAHATGPDSAARARLEGWRWVDREAGVVSVPITEAMRLLAAGDSAAGGG